MSLVDDQLDLAVRWLGEDRTVICALLIDAEGSSPFAPGAFMLIDGDGAIEGSITGGCVESDVVVNALEMVESDHRPRVLTYGVSDAAAHEVGLMCGGTVDVFVQELSGNARSVCREAYEAAARGVTTGIATLVDGGAAGAKLAVVDGRTIGGMEGPELLDHSVERDLAALSERGTSALRHYGSAGQALGSGVTVHLQAFRPAPQLVLVGAIDYSAAVAGLARQAGYDVVIADAREAFARSQRFSRAAKVHVGQPAPAIDERELGPRDAVIVFSHDPKFDEPAILAALRSEAGYIGALGSHRTARDREARLKEAGARPEDLARVHSPCGLDIGAATPEEVAISIMAEVIAARSGRAGRPLLAIEEPIRPR
ncbi:MAG TPA: XdhC family protein [Solirubrobacteraceae bacterium]|jgi:xanthine dehydrogenase accessory factor